MRATDAGTVLPLAGRVGVLTAACRVLRSRRRLGGHFHAHFGVRFPASVLDSFSCPPTVFGAVARTLLSGRCLYPDTVSRTQFRGRCCPPQRCLALPRYSVRRYASAKTNTLNLRVCIDVHVTFQDSCVLAVLFTVIWCRKTATPQVTSAQDFFGVCST